MSLGSMGIGFAGMNGSFDAPNPEDRSLGNELNYTLDQTAGVQPKYLGLEQQYEPQWNDLFNSELARSGGDTLDIYGNEFAPQLRNIEAGDREATAATYGAVAPGARAGARALNPEAAALMDKILAQAGEQLDSGMSAGELRDVQQGIRGAQAGRGVGYGPNDTFDEVYGVGMASRQLRDQATANALKAIMGSQQFYDDPMRVIFGGDTIGSRAASSVPTLAAGRAGSRVFDPENSYVQNLFSQNYAGKNQVNLANAQLRAGYAQMAAKGTDQTIQALAAAAGGGAGG